MHYETKDSGEREDFPTGSQRDTQNGKPRFDLIPLLPLTRLADLYARGADKYGDRNWEKGQPLDRYYASLFRHLIAWANGEDDEDHMTAVAWNAFAIKWTEDEIIKGRLSWELVGVFGPLASDEEQARKFAEFKAALRGGLS